MNLNSTTACNKAEGLSVPLPAITEFADAHRACRTAAEREQLALVLKARWTEAELHEYARLYFFKNGRDYPTATSYRRAIKDIAGCENWPSIRNDGPSYEHPCAWLKLFRKGGSGREEPAHSI